MFCNPTHCQCELCAGLRCKCELKMIFVRREAGVHVRIISGYLKGPGYCPDKVFSPKDVTPFRGSWNAVLVDREWRLIDSGWGTRLAKGKLVV